MGGGGGVGEKALPGNKLGLVRRTVGTTACGFHGLFVSLVALPHSNPECLSYGHCTHIFYPFEPCFFFQVAVGKRNKRQ